MLKPLRGYCLILPIDDEEEKSPSGLIVPDQAKDKKGKGRVVQIGLPPYLDSGKELEWEISQDDIVYFKRWGGEEVQEEDKKYLLVKFGDVIGCQK